MTDICASAPIILAECIPTPDGFISPAATAIFILLLLVPLAFLLLAVVGFVQAEDYKRRSSAEIERRRTDAIFEHARRERKPRPNKSNPTPGNPAGRSATEEPMRTILTAAALAAFLATPALAEPVKLDDRQLDTVAAGAFTFLTLGRAVVFTNAPDLTTFSVEPVEGGQITSGSASSTTGGLLVIGSFTIR